MEDRNTIYKSYKQRLITMNSRNSSFFLGKIYAKRHIDLVDVANEFNETNDINDKLLLNETIKLKRLVVNENNLINIFLDQDSNYQNQALNIMPQLTNTDFDNYEKLLDSDALENELSLYVRQLIKQYESRNDQIFKDFNTLTKSVNEKRRETGKADLYLGFPFIEGKIDKKDFRAPLVLHRVDIKQTGNTISIEILNEGRILNPVFLLSYLNQNNFDHKRIDFELPETVNFNFVKYAHQFLKDEGVNVTYNQHTLRKLESITKKEYIDKNFNQPNTFKIVNNAIIGMFPISNQNIYNDIDYLDKNPNETSNALNNFLKGLKEYDVKDDETPNEEDIKYITPLDWSQRIVVKNAIDNDLVIEGPPGTGKSQTIVNIIINLLLQDKKVLVISEKVAAIEVVYNRLGILRENTLIIKDHIRNKNDFFSQLTYTNENLEGKFRPKYNHKYDEKISKYLNSLQSINNANYYNEFSYEDVLELSEFKNKISFIENFQVIKNFIKDVKDKMLNIKYETKKILNDDNIEAFNNYDKQKASKLFKNIKEDELFFFIKENNKKHTYKQIQFNYYLYKLNEKPINHKHTKDVKLNLNENIYNYYDFNNYASNLHLKYMENLELISEFKKDLYNELGLNNDLIKLAISWNELTDKEKDKAIKSLNDGSNKRFCLFDIFKRKSKLNDKDIILKDYFNNYSNNFNVDMLKQLKQNLSKDELVLFKKIHDYEITKEKELVSFLLASNLIIFNDASFDKTYNEFLENKKSMDIKSIKKVNKLDNTSYEILKIFNNNKLSKDDFIEAISATYIGSEKIQEAIDTSKYLKNNEKAYLDAINNMTLKYDESLDFVYNYVKKNINDEFKVNNELYDKYSNLINQTTQNNKRSVRSLFNRYDSAIRTIYPVILMTPDVVSALFNLEQNLFDYVIFDEASQMFVERAVPSIQRSKQVIVAGDSKQLKPSSVFTSRFAESDELEDDDTLSDAELEALDKESLLDMAKGKYQAKMLKVHYRSQHKELIEFSSRAFYDNKLFFASNIKRSTNHKPIEVINAIGGMWSSDNTNMIEALEVLRIIEEILKNRTNNETIGVITFNIKQKALIEKLLEDANNDEINKEKDRINLKTLEDESLFVKNIENVQGDERDIIIFSIGYARDIDGNISARFGTLNQSGGENRLNVAITRAKEKIYVIKSIKASELKVNVNNPGPLRLKQYLQYVELVDSNNIKDKETLLNSIYKDNVKSNKKDLLFDSTFTKDVYDNLTNTLSKKYLIKANLDLGSYNIDFAIYDNNTNKFILGIKCDGYEWQLNPKDRQEDFHKEQYLINRGYNIHKILSTNWNKDKISEMNKLRKRLDDIINL